MPCYHPILAIRPKEPDETTRKPLIIGPRGKDGLDDISLIKQKMGWPSLPSSIDILQLPCGTCIGCRLAYSREWADRCYLESKMHKHNYWITLTYDDLHMKTIESIDKKTGEVIRVGTLVRKDLQNFLKRLRETWKRKFSHENILFYGCGEYGEKYHRPHYHVSLFNLPIPDIEIWYWENGQFTYKSELIEKLWGMGRVTINENSWATSAYTARYMLKKAKGKEAVKEFKETGLAPEFTAMSLKPAIGKSYYDAHKKDIYGNDTILILKKMGQPMHRKPPRYFDKLMEQEDEETIKKFKQKRRELAEQADKIKLIGKTNLDRIQYAKIEEEKIESISRSQVRKFEKTMK